MSEANSGAEEQGMPTSQGSLADVVVKKKDVDRFPTVGMRLSAAEQFREAIRAAGLHPPEVIVADGNLHRFASSGKPGDDAGWYVFHGDGIPAGIFGDWRTGLSEKWRADIGRRLTPVEVASLRERAELDRRRRNAEQERRRQLAATNAEALWKAAQPVGADHPYLDRKGIRPVSTLREISQSQAATILGYEPGAKGTSLVGRLLIAPVQVGTGIVTAELIDETGRKSAVAGGAKGGGYWAAQPLPDGDGSGLTLLVGEGVATVLSAAEATGRPVIAALSCGNLESVATQMRARYPAANVIVLADLGNGQADAERAARAVGALLARPDFGDPRPEGASDFNDMYRQQGLDAVRRAISEASVPNPGLATSSDPQDANAGSETRESDAAAIARLAAMSPLNYDRVRQAEAQRLGVRPAILDEQVKGRKTTDGDDDASSALFPALEPWPEAVNGDELLSDLVGTIRRFAVLPEHTATAIALWVLMTHASDEIDIAPILALLSPEKRCGKTTVMSLVGRLVRRPMIVANITPAALFRSIEKWGPTLMIDEADTFLRGCEELRGILNSGHSRASAFVVRTTGADFEPTPFSTWGPKCIALIGKLPDTLADRSIAVSLRRRLPHEKVEKLRHADRTLFENLARRCARFVADHELDLHRVRPAIPESLNDRAADNWEPLLIVAAIAGGDWPKRAEEAAVSLAGVDDRSESMGVELLQDIHRVFEMKGCERITSKELRDSLCSEEERPWATLNQGQPVSYRQMATLLREFGVASGSVRFGKKKTAKETAKGYTREQFADSFARYIGVPPEESVTPSQPNAGVVCDEVDIGNAEEVLRMQHGSQASADAVCDGVTDFRRVESGHPLAHFGDGSGAVDGNDAEVF